MMLNLVTDSPKCETEPANRTLQTGSLTEPADENNLNFHMLIFLKPGISVVRKAIKEITKQLH
jgi:hypothetical protein